MALLGLLAGCSSWVELPDRELQAPNPPEQWLSRIERLEGQPQGWLQRLQAPKLAELVEQALQQNPQLQNTRALLAEAEAQARIAGAERQPSLSAGAEAGRSGTGSNDRSQFSATLTFGWELDLWNKLSDSARAAEIDRQALLQDYRSARLSLAAGVAKAWFNSVEAGQQVGLSQQLVSVLADRLDVLEEGYQAGLVAALDIHLARANLAAERSRLSTRQQNLGSSVRQLELLLGRYPANRQALAQQLPPLPETIPAGLPSELLQRRFDIRAAELRVQSSWARLDRRHKDRFPSFSLTGSYGRSSDQLDQLLRGESLVWSLLGGLSQPLLDGGRLEALEAQALAQAQQREALYRDTVLKAFDEVETALQQERQLTRFVEQSQISVVEFQLAEQLAAEQYRAGLVQYITLLEAQRSAFEARSSYTQALNQQLQNRIDLYLALGGDFETSTAEVELAVENELTSLQGTP
ncbi:efflux transporter outer membrane subunit [Motiliproteus coralliicola]|uniref:efflux transporter outer membrane subunit n=1 Tax=Motiliproteus coralliicola TaxID=2283196 RepID=UPI0014031F47|nr:efflux transporter outer membrane subunit [Motiliproteus coralliicola]